MTTETRLKVSRLIRAERKRVFDAWIRPEMMSRWFCPQNLVVADVEADARIGGRYSIAMLDVERDKTFTVFGTYHEVVPDRKLVFSWEWEEPDQAESLVTVRFEEREGGTEVTVLHERYVDMAEEQGHREGWISALENLEKALTS